MTSKDTLLLILKAYLNNSYDINIDFDINELYKLSNALNVSTIVSYVLNKLNIKDEHIDKTLYKAINKYERLNDLRNNINILFNNKFDYLFIKGSSISKYYNEPYLRYSADIDVIVKDKYEEACNLLLNNGFNKKSVNKQETCLIYNGLTVDLHRLFDKNNDNYEEIYLDSFNDNHELDINYKYLYLLTHTSKHLLSGQLELRSFVDLYYLRQQIDNKVVNKLLVETNLVTFNDTINHYLDVLMGKEEYTDLDYTLEEFIFNYADDFGNRSRVLINSYGKSKISYLLNRVFIPYDKLVYDYPILNKYKILTPFYYIVRLFKPLKYKRGKYTYNELINNSKVSNDDIENMHKFIKEIGLK